LIAESTVTLSGEIITPDDDAYEAARRVFNGRIDRRPALIVQCATADDAAQALRFARDRGLPLSVRGGGHDVAGRSVNDGGMVLDLSLMKRLEVDPQARTVRAGAGLLWREFDQGTHRHRLAATGAPFSSVGLAGFTLGGGLGWLMRRYGLGCDNLLGVRIVTAEGNTLRADAREHPDLFWAVRGGGGNFGLVTELEFRLHPLRRVLGGAVLYSPGDAPQVLAWLRDHALALPEELTIMASFVTVPPFPLLPKAIYGASALALIACYAGSARAGRRALKPLRDLARPLADLIVSLPYPRFQQAFDFYVPAGSLNYWRSGYLWNLTDETIALLTEFARTMPRPLAHMDLHFMGGAVARVDREATAFSYRDAFAALSLVTTWTDPAQTDANLAWAEDLWRALRPHTRGVYVNFLGDEGPARVREAYHPDTYARLAQVKRRYDPDNVFRHNQNIPPAGD